MVRLGEPVCNGATGESEMDYQVRLLRTEIEYNDAVAEVRNLWGAPPETREGDRLDVLMVLVDNYEREQHSIEPPHPIEAIQERMDTLDISRAELGRMLGIESGRVSEILNRRRELSKSMIRTLAKELELSERCLIQPYDLARSYA